MKEDKEYGTPCSLGLVLKLDFEQVAEAIEAIEAVGARVAYRRTVPPWKRMRILVEEEGQ